jgi:hypothetical protein
VLGEGARDIWLLIERAGVTPRNGVGARGTVLRLKDVLRGELDPFFEASRARNTSRPDLGVT